MNTTAWTISTARRAAVLSRAADYMQLTKPRISVMVLIAVAVSAFVANWGQPDPIRLMHLLMGTWLVAASSSAMNQWWEQALDRKMPRTADRPLPAGRVTDQEVLLLSGIWGVLGIAYLGYYTTWQAAVFAGLTWATYVLLYTPLKSRTAWNTMVGAIAGALPIWIGWTAVEGALDWRALCLFLILFLWQFPHFMAIAHLYREEYARAGFRMARMDQVQGPHPGLQAVLAALALLPVTTAPLLVPPEATTYMVGAFLLGAAQLLIAFQFMRRQDERAARWLLRASLVYLPILLALLAFAPLGWT